jgi:arylsulfatase
MDYMKWKFERLYVLVPAQAIVRNFLVTFQEFPPRQKPGSFSLDRVLEELQQGQPK